jgi:hypothetical protein
MEIRLASVPCDSGHIFPRPLEAITDGCKYLYSGVVLIAVYRLEVPCIYKER